MKGMIMNYRLSRHVQQSNHMVISVEGYDKRAKAAELVGKTVVWKSPRGKEIAGKIAAAHGNSGKVRAIFEKGLPGQSIATFVEIK